MKMSISEIYEKLGLKDPIEYARERVLKNLEPGYLMSLPRNRELDGVNRGIGRTTYMLVHAMQRVSEGQEIVVSGRDNVRGRALAMASRLGLDAYKIKTREMDVNEEWTLVFVFDDREWSAP